jgi:hypothetical protein
LFCHFLLLLDRFRPIDFIGLPSFRTFSRWQILLTIKVNHLESGLVKFESCASVKSEPNTLRDFRKIIVEQTQRGRCRWLVRTTLCHHWAPTQHCSTPSTNATTDESRSKRRATRLVQLRNGGPWLCDRIWRAFGQSGDGIGATRTVAAAGLEPLLLRGRG